MRCDSFASRILRDAEVSDGSPSSHEPIKKIAEQSPDFILGDEETSVQNAFLKRALWHESKSPAVTPIQREHFIASVQTIEVENFYGH